MKISTPEMQKAYKKGGVGFRQKRCGEGNLIKKHKTNVSGGRGAHAGCPNAGSNGAKRLKVQGPQKSLVKDSRE